MADLADRIEEVAGQPFELESEEGRSRQHSLSSLVEADKYLRRVGAAEATSLEAMGYRRVRNRPPGAIGRME